MEVFTKKINTKKFSLFFLFDNHEGNANHNDKAWSKAIEYIAKVKKERSVVTILGGDMADCINVKDPRFSPSEIEERYSIRDLKDLPRKQYQKVARELEPIRDTIEAALIGNHEETFIKYSNFDVYDYLCTDLLQCKKLGYESLLKFSLDDKGKTLALKVAANHGTGGGGYREGYVMNHVTDLFRKFDCDIHVTGHIHKLAAEDFDFLTLGNNDKIKLRSRWYCAGGCFLNTYKEGTRGYFESRKGTLSDIGFLEIRADRVDGWEWRVKKHKFKRI